MKTTAVPSPPDDQPKSKRASCNQCLRPQKSCICQLACNLDNSTEVLIIQHPLEQKNSKGTAILTKLSLSRCNLIVGESFDADKLNNLLSDDHYNILLYPEPADSEATQAACDNATADKPTRLVILDGTWRKSRKLLHCNPLLSRLPRLSLDSTIESQYHIRKAHKPGQLSTLEACCLALEQVERLDTAPLLQAFSNFVEQQQRQQQQGRTINGTIK